MLGSFCSFVFYRLVVCEKTEGGRRVGFNRFFSRDGRFEVGLVFFWSYRSVVGSRFGVEGFFL